MLLLKKASIFFYLMFGCLLPSKASISISAPNSIWAQSQGTNLRGPIIDIASEIFGDLDLAVNTQVLPWGRAMHQLRHGQLDVMLVLNKTVERNEYIRYSVAYADIPVSVFVLKGQVFDFSTLDDLIGKKGLFIQGQQFGKKFEQFKSQLSLYAITSERQMITMLSIKRADYAISNNYAFISEARRLGLAREFDFLPQEISLTPIHMGFSRKSKYIKHIKQVNKKIIQMKEEGAFKRIISEAINSPITQP